MELCAVVCPYYYCGFFGIYTSIKRAQIALEHNLADDENVVSVEAVDGGYAYQFTTKSGKTFRAEICPDTLDAEFEEGICQENFMKCPNCGETVVFENVVDTEYHDHKHYDIGYGTCPKCNKIWGWTEVFVYAKDEDIQEMED